MYLTGQNKLSPMSIFLHLHNVKLPKFNCSFKKNPKVVENVYQIQVGQQHLKHDYTKFQV